MAKQETSLMAYAGQLTASVEQKVAGMIADGRLDLPADYSANNSLKAAQLAIMECVDRNKRPALEVCTKESVIQAMLSMVVQGLNVDKKQAYFIVYGDKLTLFRSYFGAQAVAKRVDPNIAEINASVVYKNDTIKTHKENGKLVIDSHEQDIMHMDKKDIIGAYATIVYKDGTSESEFRNFEQIKEAWKHSARNPIDDKGNIKAGTTHASETEDMCLRTVINRACKRVINTSSDSNLVAQFARETDRDMDMAAAEQDIAVNANTGEIIDVPEAGIEVSYTAEVVEEPKVSAPEAAQESPEPTEGADGQMELA